MKIVENTVTAIMVIFVLVFLYFFMSAQKSVGEEPITEQVSHDVILNSVREVISLTVIEANFTEIYTKEDYWKLDLSPFRKKMVVKVKANVGVGYDLNELYMDVDRESKTILVLRMPSPKLLYIDDTLEYFDISEGYFNWFDPGDYTEIDRETRDKIESMVTNSSLFTDADIKLFENLKIIRNLASEMGWTVVIKD